MDKKKRLLKRVTTIKIEPYLAEYAKNKYEVDTTTGAIKIPYNSDLYFCIWENMKKRTPNKSYEIDGNLRIHLPFRKASEECPWKDPAYYNYLSQASAKKIETQLRRMFNFELHRILMENEEFGHERRNLDVIYDFIQEYKLRSISSDALLKNYYRYRNKLRPKKIRKYEKSSRN